MKVANDSTVLAMMIRATRPLSAPKRSASSETLLALGSAATSTITISPNAGTSMPAARSASPAVSTSSGCSSSLMATTGR